MVTDTSAESRKVDKKTALALWDSAVLPPAVRKRRVDETPDEPDRNDEAGAGTMTFTVITKRGNKQNVRTPNTYPLTTDVPVIYYCIEQSRHIAVPVASPLAVHTRSAQLQDKVEQQHLKRLVLDYEQREEAEELKGTPM